MSIQSRLEKVQDIRGANEQQINEHGRLLLMRDKRDAGRLIEVLDDGFVCEVDHMGNDISVVRNARVSYGKGTKSVSDDRALIRYMMAHKHTSPFEAVEFQFLVRVPMDTWRQWIRHRTASVSEYSTRYSEAIDAAQEATEWRLQARDNKQGSASGEVQYPDGFLVEEQKLPMTAPEYLSQIERRFQNFARSVYQERLEFGVAREQARKDLPLSTYTEAYWKIDLHNLLHFLELRMHKHAQFEIRSYANAIADLIKPIVPLTWEAFEDYRLNAMTLSFQEQAEIRRALHPNWAGQFKALSDRERKELNDKLEWLGIPEPPQWFPSNEELAS